MTLGLAPGVCIGRLIFNNILGRIGIIIYQSVNDLPNPGLDPACSQAFPLCHASEQDQCVRRYFHRAAQDGREPFRLSLTDAHHITHRERMKAHNAIDAPGKLCSHAITRSDLPL